MFAGGGLLNHACDFWRNAIHFRPNCLQTRTRRGRRGPVSQPDALAWLNTHYGLVAWALGLVEACPLDDGLGAAMFVHDGPAGSARPGT